MNETNKKLCEELWTKLEPRLRVICEVKLAGLPDEVDDVIAEVFTALCEKTEKSRPPEHPQAWLYGVLNNKIGARLREICQKKETELPLPEEAAELPYEPTESGIDEMTNGVIAADIADRARAFLREDESELIEAIYFRNLSHRDYAQGTGTTEAAVKQKHYRIMKKLRRYFLKNDASASPTAKDKND